LRPRTIKIVVRLSGFDMPVASVKIQKYADVLKPETDLLCRKCKQKPKWNGGYACPCGERYNHWSQLMRVDKATGGELVVGFEPRKNFPLFYEE